MSKVATRSFAEAEICAAPEGATGQFTARTYFDGEADPVRLRVHCIGQGDAMSLEPIDEDRLAYVWQGEIEAGGRRLVKGSSLIVEHGAGLDIVGRDTETRLAIFAPGRPTQKRRPGGHVHLMPRNLVPRVEADTASGTSGGLHANGQCAGCELWLNENFLPGQAEAPSDENALRGVHAHPENEVIFVTEGQIRLGNRLYDSGTALAIAADTLYGFSPGPDGLSFITFRPSGTTAIRFASGGDYIHSTFWDHIGVLDYLEPLAG